MFDGIEYGMMMMGRGKRMDKNWVKRSDCHNKNEELIKKIKKQ